MLGNSQIKPAEAPIYYNYCSNANKENNRTEFNFFAKALKKSGYNAPIFEIKKVAKQEYIPLLVRENNKHWAQIFEAFKTAYTQKFSFEDLNGKGAKFIEYKREIFLYMIHVLKLDPLQIVRNFKVFGVTVYHKYLLKTGSWYTVDHISAENMNLFNEYFKTVKKKND